MPSLIYFLFLKLVKMPALLGLAFLFLFCSPTLGQTSGLTQKALDLHLDQDSEWLLLLDYKKTFFGKYKSEADGLTYFLSPNGKNSPKDELIQNIHAIFEEPTINDNSARCRFPARAYYLAKKLEVTLPSDTPCGEWQKFYSSFKAESVSVVFSSYFINNPSSTFGHTFLRFNQPRSLQDTDLTDLSVNFAANPWSQNPFIYTLGGLIGWFPGIFSTIPYYYKVREYNNFESRDLWSYKLDLSKEELDQLIRHLWEYKDTHFDYFFFTENCSYHLMTAIEAAAPRLHLSEDLHPWVIPSDTILNLYKKNYVKEISYRPSSQNTFLGNYSFLNKSQKAEAKRIILSQSPEVSWTLPQEDRIAVIDTTLDWIDYKYNKEIQNKSSWQYQWYNSLLDKRAILPVVEPHLLQEPKIKPHLGHPSERAGVSFGYNNQIYGFQRISMRFALHDLLDPQGGYPENTQIEFANLTLQLRNHLKRIELQQSQLVDVITLNPLNDFEKGFSWKMSLGTRTFQNKDCFYCHGINAQFAAGIALGPSSKILFYTFLQTEPIYSESFKGHKLRNFVGPEVGFLINPAFNFKIHSFYNLGYDITQKNSYSTAELSLRKSFANKWSLGTKTRLENDILENSLEAYFYF